MPLTDVERKLAERYGRAGSPARRIVAWTVGGIVAVSALGLLGWSVVGGAIATVDADTTGYAVVDERTVDVRILVSAPTGSPVACALEAQDPEHGIVGWRIVEYPASAEHSRSFTESIPTLAEATTGLVRSCWIP
ncbi:MULTISPECIES: DUF4307 domain-containing protein [unclassified Microbacterium]|uniref:DUF4307 domain-containing protein n=1 Tax=unclassified Microbacterium TaxID=2609290 RepID=UPI00386A4531